MPTFTATALLITIIIGSRLAISLILNGMGPRLLPWSALVFIMLLGPAAILFPYFEAPESSFTLEIDPRTLENLHIALVITTCIIILFLLLEKRSIMLQANPRALFFAEPRIALLFYVSMVGFGFVLYQAIKNGSLAALPAVLKAGEYGYYSNKRLDAIDAGSNIITTYCQVLLYNIPLPLLCLFLFQRMLTTGRQYWLWLLTFAFWTTSNLLTLAKSPIVIQVIAHAIILISTRRSPRGTTRWMVGMVAPVAIVLGSLLLVYRAVGFNEGIAAQVFSRFFLEPIWLSYYYFDVFPASHSFTYFGNSHILNLVLAGGLKPNYVTGYIDVARIVAVMASGSAYNANNNILGSGWANFGFVGVAESAIVIFGVCFFWDRVLVRRQSPSRFVPLLAFVISKSLTDMTNSDFVTTLLSTGLIHAPVWFLILEGCSWAPSNQQAPRKKQDPAMSGAS